MKEKTKLFYLIIIYLIAYFMPWGHPTVRQSGFEAFMMLQEYAREHVLTCLIPAFFIADAIAVFISHASVLKYFGAEAKKVLAYSVASVSGTILAVCSCTVLPLFSGIYTRGSGIGPATAFLYSGPAINVLAITLTAKILGWQIGLARAIGAIIFAIITGILMAIIFRKDDASRTTGKIYMPEDDDNKRSLLQDSLYLLTEVAHCNFNNAVWPVIRRGAGNRCRCVDRSSGDVDAGSYLSSYKGLVSYILELQCTR